MMELRVWVDGTQRVVCGVKLTTTCQEIVFALAHATQQAGRFTMIERWRNNERLLSPNEQPLVTLQRWGDRMNEVEFILRKTSTDPLHPPQAQQAQQTQALTSMPPQQQQQPQQTINSDTNTVTASVVLPNQTSQQLEREPDNRQQTIANGASSHNSPAPNLVTPQSIKPQTTQQPSTDQTHDNLFQQRHYNLNRRPQTSLGPLTSSSSALNPATNDFPLQSSMNRIAHTFRPSLSASVLPNPVNNGPIIQSNSSTSMLRSCYADEKSISPSLYSTNNNPQNGYTSHNDAARYQQANANPLTKSFPYEDLYSTINKKRTSQPPAVPAKPRLISNIPHPQPPINNAQMNYYHSGQSPVHMIPTNLRPRHPPGYMEYLEAMANRNSLPASLVSNPNFIHQNQSNVFPRPSYDVHNHQQFYNIHQQQNGSSPADVSNGNQYYYNNRTSYNLGNELNQPQASMRNHRHQVNPKLVESGLIINRGSAVNIKLAPSSQNTSLNQSSLEEQRLDTSTQNQASSVSQMGLDMLKVIEEQKRVLLNQKNELDRLDRDKEYLEAKQNSEQVELINRIEKEIAQLETLWRENQIQIRKLENQDFERELELLKAEQVRMERELNCQKNKLFRFETDITRCKSKIDQLESELESVDGSDVENNGEASTDDEDNQDEDSGRDKNSSKDDVSKTISDSTLDLKSSRLYSNGSSSASRSLLDHLSDDDEEEEGASEGDASDEPSIGTKGLPCNGASGNGVGKVRSAKDVAYVDKRGLISGIRSLKLDKTRAQNRSNERINAAEGLGYRYNLMSPLVSSHLIHKDKSPETSDISVQNTAESTTKNEANSCVAHESKSEQNIKNATANNNNIGTSNNKYDFLMTL